MLLSAAVALGDTVDDSLPANSPAAVKVSARQAIQSGLAPQPVIELTKAMLQHQFDEQQVQRAHALLTEAKTSNTPVQPLMNKAFEGMAKNVPPALIVGAMETVQARNSFAFAARSEAHRTAKPAQNLGQVLAASLAAGLSKEDANEIIGKIQQHASSLKAEQAYNLALECFQTARDVSRLGVSSQAVTGMVVQALSKGFSHEDMNVPPQRVYECRHSTPIRKTWRRDIPRPCRKVKASRGWREPPVGKPASRAQVVLAPGVVAARAVVPAVVADLAVAPGAVAARVVAPGAVAVLAVVPAAVVARAVVPGAVAALAVVPGAVAARVVAPAADKNTI